MNASATRHNATGAWRVGRGWGEAFMRDALCARGEGGRIDWRLSSLVRASGDEQLG